VVKTIPDAIALPVSPIRAEPLTAPWSLAARAREMKRIDA
jgi:hypothetical protein